MAKISLIAIIWVWHCVAYGQLSVHSPYYIPYISTFVTQPHNQQKYDETALGRNAGELLKITSLFRGSIHITIRRLEAIITNLAKELKDTTAKLEKNISDLKDELKTKATKDDLAKKADQSELVKTNAELLTTKDDLAKKADQSELIKTNAELLTTKDEVAKKADQSELEKMNSGLQTTSNNLATMRTELSDTKSDVEDLTIKLNAMTTSEIVDIGQMPTSCSDLQLLGHKLSGFFSVKGSKKMEMIYCNFNPNQNDKQKLIGYIDVKSTPVYFYVQRDSSFTTTDTPIPFQVEVVNEGNAMDLKSGKFTAPRPGIYFFSFMGLARFPVSSSSLVWLRVYLYLNGDYIGAGWVEEANIVAGQLNPLTLQSTLNLKKDDQVWVEIDWMSSGATLFDNNGFTHFTGFLLEEEIVASL